MTCDLLYICGVRMSGSWERAQESVAAEKRYLFTNSKKILLFPGLVSS